MKKILVLFLVIVSSLAFAQYEDVDLASYKTPDYSRHQLWGRFSGNNSIRRDNDISIPDENQYDHDYGASLNGDLYYYWEKSTREFQRNLDVDLHLNGRLDDDDDWRRTYNNISFTYDLYINKQDRKYFQNGLFAETNVTVDHRYYRNKYRYDYHESESTLEQNYKSNAINVYCPIKFGRGRIEFVGDARRAIYILQALDEAGRIADDVKDEDIVDLAELINELRNRRVFDSRLGTMEKIEDLDRFLQSRSMINKPDSRYFVTLDDMWRYSNANNRYSGSRVAIAFRPGIEVDYDKDIEDDTYVNERNTVIDLGVEYVKENPMDLYWQESIEACFYVVYNDLYRYRSYNSHLDEAQYMNLNASIERRYTYYPNTRTEMEFRLGISYANGIVRLGETPELLLADAHMIHGLAGYDISYYITPKLSLSARHRLEYMWAGSLYSIAGPIGRSFRNYSASLNAYANDEHQFYSYFSISIDYKIF